MKKLPLAGLMLLALSTVAVAQEGKRSPELISVTEVVYPKDDILPGVEGRPEFQGTVTLEGAVENIKLVKSSGFPPLDKAAEESIKTGKFKPGTDKDGKPMAQTVLLPVEVLRSPTNVERPCLWFNNELAEFARFNPALGVNDLKSINVIRGAYISGLFGGNPVDMAFRIMSAGKLVDETVKQCKETPDSTVLTVIRAAAKKFGG